MFDGHKTAVKYANFDDELVGFNPQMHQPQQQQQQMQK